MRSQDYLKQAANSLRQAAVARKQEMDDLRHQLDMEDQEAKRRLNELRGQERDRLNKAAETASDVETHSRTREAQMMREEESRVNDQFNSNKRQIDQQLSNMQDSINNFNQLAQSLDNQGSS